MYTGGLYDCQLKILTKLWKLKKINIKEYIGISISEIEVQMLYTNKFGGVFTLHKTAEVPADAEGNQLALY